MSAHRIFINYRRDPEAGEPARARNLAQLLRGNFGDDSVFLDADAIVEGERWPQRLQHAVAATKVCLCVIGPRWLAASYADFRRRLDDPEDWVRKELEHANSASRTVIPVLVGGAKLPKRDDLPAALQWLVECQACEIRDDAWASDVKAVVRVLRGELADTSASGIIYPVAPAFKPLPLTDDQIHQICTELPEWRVEKTQVLDDPRVQHGTKVELVRVYQFDTFLDVIAFMSRASNHIDAMDHHPRWENIYKTLIVRITTWDIEHRLSDRDAVLARYLEREYFDYLKRRK